MEAMRIEVRMLFTGSGASALAPAYEALLLP